MMSGFMVLRRGESEPLYIPHELSETIICYLEGNVKSMSSAALVCRSWASSCRPYFFRKLTLHPGVAQRMMGLISGSGHPLIDARLCKLPPLSAYCRTLAIRNVVIRDNKCPVIQVDNPLNLQRHPLRALFSTLTTLTITNCSFLTLESLVRFISCFSNLDTLTLHEVHWCSSSSTTIPRAVTLSSIRCLNLRNVHWRQIFMWINQGKILENVKRLQLGELGEWDVTYISRYMIHISEQLEYLSMQFKNDGDSAPIVHELPADLLALSRSTLQQLQQNTHPSSRSCPIILRDQYRKEWGLQSSIYPFPKLVTLRIVDFVNLRTENIHNQANARFWTPRTIATIVSPNLQIIKFHMVLNRVALLDRCDINWRFMDYILSSEDYPSLKSVEFCVEGLHELDSVQHLISARMPLMKQRGLLAFRHAGPAVG